MKLVVVSIRDSALAAYMRPYFCPTTGVAIRAFQDAMKKDQEMYSHRDDYVLFKLGTFDEESGKFDNMDSPEQLFRGSDVIGDRNES